MTSQGRKKSPQQSKDQEDPGGSKTWINNPSTACHSLFDLEQDELILSSGPQYFPNVSNLFPIFIILIMSMYPHTITFSILQLNQLIYFT